MNAPTRTSLRRRPFPTGARWVRTGVFGALSLLACAAVQALGLGRLSVQSALGESLRAEIEVTSITPAEEASLSLRIATPQVYRSAGIEFNEILGATRLTLARRVDGRVVVELRSDRPARDAFIDVILEANWSTGRLVREYTLLMNPPATTPPGTSGVAVAVAIEPAPPAPAPVSAPPPASAPAPATAPAPAPTAAPTPAPVPAAVAVPPAVAAAPPTPAVDVQPSVATPLPVAPPAPAPSVAIAPVAPAPVPAPVQPPAPANAAPPAAPARGATARAAAAPAQAASAPGVQHVVRAGETLYRVAVQHRPEGVSLDQMLVSIYRSNPQAFIGRNMNRLMAGAVLAVPSAEQAQAVDDSEAKGLIEAQSADFGAYRARLAAAVPQTTQEPAASRQASGRVEARVQDRKAQAALTPDQLKLSQGGMKAASSPEASLSRSAAARDSAQREAELARNVEALRQLQQLAGSAAGKSPPSAAAGPAAAGGVNPTGTGPAPATPSGAVAQAGAAASSPALLVASARTAAASAPAASAADTGSAAASAAAAASAPGEAASAGGAAANASSAAASASAVAAVAASAPASASAPAVSVARLRDALVESPFALPAAAALIVLLASLGAYRLVRGRRTGSPETAFLASRYDGESFSADSDTTFGRNSFDAQDPRAAGLDERALSQLGAMSDVDPVAEADVYLAYGRDRQAEEILREAMRAAPQRLDIAVKLLEVLALRREGDSFEPLARDVHAATGGQGAQWAQVASMGRTLDPDNPLYATAMPDFDRVGQGLDDVTPPVPDAGLAGSGQALPGDVVQQAVQARRGLPPVEPGAELESDLSLDIGAEASPLATEQAAAATQAAEAALGPTPGPVESDDFLLDLGQDAGTALALPDDDFPDLTAEQPLSAEVAEPLEVDLAAVDLTTDDSLDAGAAPEPPPEDPLERKLALANEFLQIGDLDGARDLLDEVLAQAEGPMKDRARELLETLG